MCLLVFAWRAHPRHRLVLAGNRDEFHARPAAPADWWTERADLLAGRDLEAGGTWLGVTRAGRFAVVTNFREMGERRPHAPSRGRLVVDYAAHTAGPVAWLEALATDAQRYAGFNLVAGDADTVAYYSNRDGAPRALAPGIYGLSNHLLDTPWPKLERVRARFTALLRAPRVELEDLLAPLADTTPAADDELPRTGLTHALERALSAPFIVTPSYGTRCSTALVIDGDGRCELLERRFDPAGSVAGESRFAFATGPDARR
jgi:uncharacterized protein with NRDE domain